MKTKIIERTITLRKGQTTIKHSLTHKFEFKVGNKVLECAAHLSCYTKKLRADKSVISVCIGRERVEKVNK
jgi:hypothetical protein